jgi:hypothetical protein
MMASSSSSFYKTTDDDEVPSSGVSSVDVSNSSAAVAAVDTKTDNHIDSTDDVLTTSTHTVIRVAKKEEEVCYCADEDDEITTNRDDFNRSVEQFKKEEEEENNDDNNNNHNNVKSEEGRETYTDTEPTTFRSKSNNMPSHHVAAASSDSAAVKKEEEEEEKEEEEEDLTRLVKKGEEEKYDEINCNNNNKKEDNDDFFADWKVGNWCWVLPSTNPTCNDEGTTTQRRRQNQQNGTNNHSVISRPECRKRTTRSHNTSSINNEDTPKKKKARSLSPPPPSNRNNTDIMQEEDNEVNNKMNDDDNDDDDDGYESWTEGNWCLLLPTGSSSTSATVKIRNEQKHSSEISHASTKHRNCRKIPSHTALHADNPDKNTECDENYSNDDDDSDNNSNDDDDDDDDDEPKKSRTQKNSLRYTKAHNKKWNDMFHRLISYKKQYNSTSVPRRYTSDPKLGSWVNNQRMRNEAMPEYRTNLLNSIGFVWNALDNHWDKNFQRLVTYKKQHHGSTLVPAGYKADNQLAIWVREQRLSYNNSTSRKIISVDWIKRLESIGFVWYPHDVKWMKNYNRLVSYKNKHKSSHVPSNYNGDNQLPQLGAWVYNQRYLYRDGKLLKKREEFLNSINFEWEGKKQIFLLNRR